MVVVWSTWYWRGRDMVSESKRYRRLHQFTPINDLRCPSLARRCTQQRMPWYWYQSPDDAIWHGRNFGDDYNLPFGAALLGRPAKRLLRTAGSDGLWMTSNPNTASKVVACGSVLPTARSHDVVAGAGGYSFQRRIAFDHLRNSTIASVRGPVTFGLLRNHAVPAPDVFVDPGLLAGTLVWPELYHVHRGNSTCVLLHGSDAKLTSAFDAFSVEFLSVHEAPYDIAVKMQRCRLVISSSLHGLVFADAFQIRSVWLHTTETSQRPAKFIDYFSSLHQVPVFAASVERAFQRDSRRPVLSLQHLYATCNAYVRTFPLSRVCSTGE